MSRCGRRWLGSLTRVLLNLRPLERALACRGPAGSFPTVMARRPQKRTARSADADSAYVAASTVLASDADAAGGSFRDIGMSAAGAEKIAEGLAQSSTMRELKCVRACPPAPARLRLPAFACPPPPARHRLPATACLLCALMSASHRWLLWLCVAACHTMRLAMAARRHWRSRWQAAHR